MAEPTTPIALRRIAQTVLRFLSIVLPVFAIAAFVTPATLLGFPDAAGPVASLVQSVVFAAFGVVAVATLVAAMPGLGSRFRGGSALLAAAAAILAIGNASRLALGIQWGGLGPELLLTAWFVAPLALWAAAAWPALRRQTSWWATPMRWVLVAFPLAFLLAALADIDFRTYVGGPAPAPVAWLFAYGPTLALVAACVAGWLAHEEQRAPTRPQMIRSALPPAFIGVLLGIAVSALSSLGFILSATITWGSGHQLFRTPPPLPPLGLAFALIFLAVSGYLVTLFRYPRRGDRLTLLLLLSAVLAGIFPSAVSVLGSLAALELAWLRLTPEVAPASRVPEDSLPAPVGGGAG